MPSSDDDPKPSKLAFRLRNITDHLQFILSAVVVWPVQMSKEHPLLAVLFLLIILTIGLNLAL